MPGQIAIGIYIASDLIAPGQISGLNIITEASAQIVTEGGSPQDMVTE
tara:strand:- start:420 stop:563 length:144 start_codon:yes stop_codon:yes gene_type:complete